MLRAMFALISLLLIPLTSFADATDELLQRLAPLKSLSGEFKQTQFLQNSEAPRYSSGTFTLLRPGYFSWNIESPDSQLILATPKYIWQYDRDLDTVSRRPVSNEGDMSPLQVLGGKEERLREDYKISSESGEGGADFELTPLKSGAGFKLLTLQFRGDAISGMRITDNLGQRIEVIFSALKTNQPISATEFDFTPPPGADLFYHD